jgi:hypothetical protein
VSEQIYLTQYGIMVARHWREFRPKTIRELEKNGTLMEALFEAQEPVATVIEQGASQKYHRDKRPVALTR